MIVRGLLPTILSSEHWPIFGSLWRWRNPGGSEKPRRGGSVPPPRGTAGQVPGGIIHADHGTQFTSWTFTERARKAGLLPSLGTVGDPYDNAVAEAFWGRLQTELLDRQRRRTRVELANAIFEYIEGFYNRRRRHSALDWMSPLQFETTTRTSSPISSPASP
ncbi:hypothetical protein GCM10009550_25430 [Actinocorallia libanotica]|uniref:Integrase catalytic domain-containing protein n=1 Tax=Actinocorallia libanotica TaxID=46162 RepID=A0ABN1QXP6_9ACTN